MSLRIRSYDLAWLSVVAVATAGGWISGRAMVRGGADRSAPSVSETRQRELPQPVRIFPPGSPKDQWMAAVKRAEAGDFPELLSQWKKEFEFDEGFTEGRSGNALRWFMAMWLAKDPDGFVEGIATGGTYLDGLAAQTLVRLMPDEAVRMLSGDAPSTLRTWFALGMEKELATQFPERYLLWDPDGTRYDKKTEDDNWLIAVTALAKTDPTAAADVCLRWKRASDLRTIARALQTVAAAWPGGFPSFKVWVEGISDPQMKRLAMHAGISVLAEKDPRAALGALQTVDPGDRTDQDSRGVILMQLATSDLSGALQLMRHLELGMKSPTDPSADPFANPFADDRVAAVSINADPILRSFLGFGTGAVRTSIVQAAAKKLPVDPKRFFEELKIVTSGINGTDGEWQKSLQSDFIREKSFYWTAAECLEAAAIWGGSQGGEGDEMSLRALATRTAELDPRRAMASLSEMPEAFRAEFAGNIINKGFETNTPPDPSLFRELAPQDWNSALGENMGRYAEQFAGMIAALPADTGYAARFGFMRQWGELDPEAASDWLTSLPADAGTVSANRALAFTWARYDEYAATGWAAGLEAGPVRDAAADGIVRTLVLNGNPQAAWQWASSISDPKLKADALQQVGNRWAGEAPEEFRAELEAARIDKN